MASFGSQLSFFLLLVLILSPQIQAREGKLFSFFTHFKTISNVKNPQVLLNIAKAESPSPITAPTPSPITAPAPSPITAPAPASAPEQGSIIVSGPAPDPGFVDSGEGYGLYGSDSNQYSPTKETPTTTTTFENELLNEDFTDEKYKTGYPKTNFYSNNNNNNNEVYRNNYNNQEEYKNNYNNGYNKNYVDSYSNNNYNYNENGYERKREGMSDTRFLENGKYYYHVPTNDENYNLNNVYESERGSTENEGYYEKRQYPNEFDTMEEYEKQQASQGYKP